MLCFVYACSIGIRALLFRFIQIRMGKEISIWYLRLSRWKFIPIPHFIHCNFFFSRDKNLINQSSFHHHRISHGREVIIFLRFRNAISQYERDSIALQLRQSRATPYIHDTKEGREEKEQGSKRKRKIIRAGVSRWLSPPLLEILLKLGSISVNTTQSFRVDLRGDITTIVPPPFTYYPPHNFASIREDNLG